MDECQVEYGRVRGWEKRSRLQTKSKVVIVPQRLMAVHQNPFPSSCPESKATLPACLTPCLLLLGLDNKNFTGALFLPCPWWISLLFPSLTVPNLDHSSQPWVPSSTLLRNHSCQASHVSSPSPPTPTAWTPTDLYPHQFLPLFMPFLRMRCLPFPRWILPFMPLILSSQSPRTLLQQLFFISEKC